MGTDCAASRRSFLKTATAATAWGLTAALATEEASANYRKGPAEQDLLGMSVVAIAELLEKREISPVELARAAITRIEETGKSINAFTFRPPAKTILDQAVAAEQRIANGDVNWREQPLTGVPITIKDCLDVKGMPTSSGVPKFAQRPATADATVVRRLRNAGAIILGKTNLPALLSAYETENTTFGRTNNPYDESCTPGGSSGGEAAIIAAGGSWLGVGSDGLGSIRVPAHCCGIAGLRPGWGRVSRAGHVPPPQPAEGVLPDPGYLTVGPLARTVRDLYVALSIMQGPDPLDPNSFPLPLEDYADLDIRGLEIAYWIDSAGAVLTRETRATLEKAKQELEKAGATVTEDKPPLADAIHDISQALYSPFFLEEWESTLHEHGVEEFCPIDTDMVDGLRAWRDRYTAKQVENFQSLLPELKTGFLTFLTKYDAVISPVVTTPAPKHATTFDDIHRLVFVQLPAYVPAVPSGSVPCGFSVEDANTKPLPIGVQVIGRQFREDTVLAIMSLLERELGGWHAPRHEGH